MVFELCFDHHKLTVQDDNKLREVSVFLVRQKHRCKNL